MTTLHVVPIGDQVNHDTSTADTDCVCGPEARPATQVDGSVGWLLVHHSLDGQEHGHPVGAGHRTVPAHQAGRRGRAGRHGVRHGDR